MNDARPDLATARRMLKQAQRRKRIRRWLVTALIVVIAGALAAGALLQTEPFQDVYRQLIGDLGLV